MNNQEIIIEQVTEVSETVADALRSLAKQEGDNFKELTEGDVNDMLTSPNTTLFVAKTEEDDIVGMITLLVFRIPYLRKGYIDDVVVDSAFRGKGIAKQLMQAAIDTAKEKGVSYIDLTAKPEREEGNGLYDTFGFQKRNTNVYRLAFDYGKH